MVRAKSELYEIREANIAYQWDKEELVHFADRVLMIDTKPAKGSNLLQLADIYSGSKGNGTKFCYKYLSTLVKDYKGAATNINEISHDWLVHFHSWMDDRGLSVNSIGVVMRSLRALVDYAIEEGLYKKEYPFRRFKIKKEETAKCSLSVSKIRARLSIPLDGGYE